MVMQNRALYNISFPPCVCVCVCVWKFPQWNTFSLVDNEAGFFTETLFKNVDKYKVLPRYEGLWANLEGSKWSISDPVAVPSGKEFECADPLAGRIVEPQNRP